MPTLRIRESLDAFMSVRACSIRRVDLQLPRTELGTTMRNGFALRLRQRCEIKAIT